MTQYTLPVDIGNRALQHVGAPLITTFSDNSKNAVQIAFAYDKVRRAELRRAVWRFATRRAVIRPFASGQVYNPAAWSSVTTYTILQCVTYNGVVYQSTIDPNLNFTPGSGSTNAWAVYVGPSVVFPFNIATTYYAGDLVLNSVDGIVYGSLANAFSGQAPPNSNYWFPRGVGTVAGLYAPGPIGYDNSSATPLYAYRLPFGYLRVAPQDRKAADTEVQAVSAGMRYSDFSFEGDFLLTANAGPLFFRFVADINVVTSMDDMFIEGFAARLGMAVVEPLTQSKDKLQVIAGAYSRFMREARAINALEIGNTDNMDDDELVAKPAAPGVPANG